MATKRRKAVKMRIVPTKQVKRERDFERIYRDTQKQVQKVNERLKSLEKRYSKGKGTWSVKLLQDRLDTDKYQAWKKGRISISKSMTQTQLLAINKASSQFLKRKTSTKKGVEEVREETKKSLFNTLKLQNDDLTMSDIDDFYSILGDSDAKPFLKTDVMGASALEVAIQDAISYNDDLTNFIERIETYMTIADNETREKVKRLYKKYVKPKVIDIFEETNIDDFSLLEDFNLY